MKPKIPKQFSIGIPYDRAINEIEEYFRGRTVNRSIVVEMAVYLLAKRLNIVVETPDIIAGSQEIIKLFEEG